MSDESARVRGWVFTVNNPTSAIDWPLLGDCYLVYQKEKGESGTEHFQGVVFFKNKRTFRSVRSILPDGCHIESMKGTLDQAVAYCTKEDTRIEGPWKFGEKPAGQGGRTDLLAVKKMIDEGHSEKEIADKCFGTWCRHDRAFKRYRVLTTPGRTWQTTLIVYWGPPGTGKSSHALELGSDSQYWLPPPDKNGSVWWDGYDGQETVVIDEFYGWIRRDILQRVVDRYPYYVQTKGGSTPFVAKTIIITSNKPPEMWYQKVGLGGMVRRLAEPVGYVFFFGKNGVSSPVEEMYYRRQLGAESAEAGESPPEGGERVDAGERSSPVRHVRGSAGVELGDVVPRLGGVAFARSVMRKRRREEDEGLPQRHRGTVVDLSDDESMVIQNNITEYIVRC